MGTDLQIKYRPRSLKEFIGNTSVVKAISEDFHNGRLKHCIMFIGESGVGKTTLSYIISKTLLQCHEVSIREINAADARGIDDVRDIIKDVSTRPILGENKVFIIDEAHQLTKDAQNALLKPLENERNSHVYWIFCTTNPNSIIKTIKNRCTQYTLGTLSTREIIEALRPIIEAEQINIPEPILKIIVSRANGIPREAVKLLDQFRYAKDKSEVEQVIKEFGTETDEFENLAKFLKQPWSKIGPKLKLLYEKKSPEAIRIGLLSYYSICLENSSNPEEMNLYSTIMASLWEPIVNMPHKPQITYMLFQVNQELQNEQKFKTQ